MADSVKVRLLRPLNNEAIGTEKEYARVDAERLAASGAVEIVKAKAAAPKPPAAAKAPAAKKGK